MIGFDDAPFPHRRGATVILVGVVCAGARFEGMVTARTRRDGWGATDALCGALVGGKFLPQLHAVLLDGIAFGGLNVVDLPALAARLARPCIAVMRRAPDLPGMEAAIRKLPGAARRLERLHRAGEIHELGGFVFQVEGATAEVAAQVLARVTDRGRAPEALRLAHLVGGAIVHGESGRGA